MENPKISVITVTYNCGATIERTLRSVLDQGYDNLEYIIIDGQSTDHTMQVVDRYADRLACVVSEPDKGIYDAMNKGLDRVTGDFVYFIGGDDVMFDGVLNTIAPHMNDTVKVYYGNVIMQPINKRYLGKFSKCKFLRKNICHQAIFYGKETFANGRRYTMQYRLLADYLMNLDLWSEGFEFEYIDRDIAIFQLAGASGAGDKDFVHHWPSIIRKRFNTVDYLYFILRVRLVYKTKEMTKQIIGRK